MPAKSMYDVTKKGTRLQQLKNLALVLAEYIDDEDSDHSMAQLARQYREVIAEIDLIENEDTEDDLITELRNDRAHR